MCTVCGLPKQLHAFSSNKNVMAYWKYGNHKSCATYADKYKKVMIKDSKHGNKILVDPSLLPFIPDLHLTAQGMVNVINKWKSSLPVFDSSFHPDYWCKAINNWVSIETKGDVTFAN